jgi:hypothetical protein
MKGNVTIHCITDLKCTLIETKNLVHKLPSLAIFFAIILTTALLDQNLFRSWQVTGWEANFPPTNFNMQLTILVAGLSILIYIFIKTKKRIKIIT